MMSQSAPGGVFSELGSDERIDSENGLTEEDSVWIRPEWKIRSLLFGYPGDREYPELLSDALDWARELRNEDLEHLIQAFQASDRNDLVSQYVRYFDFQSKTSLYLTAHELGDSRKRGLALVALRRQLAEASFFEATDTGLPDYLPLLFEFLGAKPVEIDASNIEVRLARVCRMIRSALPDESLYARVFDSALQELPDASLLPDGQLFSSPEKPDLEDLPYPLFYD